MCQLTPVSPTYIMWDNFDEYNNFENNKVTV